SKFAPIISISFLQCIQPVSKNRNTIFPSMARLVLITGRSSTILKNVNSGIISGAFVGFEFEQAELIKTANKNINKVRFMCSHLSSIAKWVKIIKINQFPASLLFLCQVILISLRKNFTV